MFFSIRASKLASLTSNNKYCDHILKSGYAKTADTMENNTFGNATNFNAAVKYGECYYRI